MTDNIYLKYSLLRDKIAKLETEKGELELKIFDALDDDGQTFKETPYGNFHIMGRKTYEYSEKIKAMLVGISKLKKIEELRGVATLKSDSRHIRFMIPKIEEVTA